MTTVIEDKRLISQLTLKLSTAYTRFVPRQYTTWKKVIGIGGL